MKHQEFKQVILLRCMSQLLGHFSDVAGLSDNVCFQGIAETGFEAARPLTETSSTDGALCRARRIG
jgi:hypothetical protein